MKQLKPTFRNSTENSTILSEDAFSLLLPEDLPEQTDAIIGIGNYQ